MVRERDDFLARLIEMIAQVQPSFTDEMAVSLETQIRSEFAGEEIYIRKSSRRDQMELDIKRRFNGRNAMALAHEWGVSRRTIYRIAGK